MRGEGAVFGKGREALRAHAHWLPVPAWALAYLLFAAVLLGANPWRAETVGPFDLLNSYAGWHAEGSAQVPIRNGQRSDVLDAILPRWNEARRQLRDGQVPLWNPLPAGGEALLLNPVNSLLTPAFAAFAMSPDPARGFYFSVLVNLAIAGLGMHLLVAGRLGGWAGVFAGNSYMACGFISAWLYWPHVNSAIWVPWLLLAVGRFCDSRSWLAFLGIAFATALMFLGGFPFVIAIGFGAALVHAAMVSIRQPASDAAMRMLGVVLGIGLGLCLVAVPFLTLVSMFDGLDLSRRGYGSVLTLQEHRKLLVWPWAWQVSRVEWNMYAGTLALLLAVVGMLSLRRRPRNPLTISAVVLFVVGILLTFGILPREIGAHLPVLSNNPWNRAILLLDIAIILLAAAGLHRLVGAVRWRPAAALVAIAACAVQMLDLGAHFRRFNGPTPAALYYPVSPEVEAVRQAIHPFQYVGQDSGLFIFSGTLGGVGLGDWYAHSFRTQALARMLGKMADNPETSPTATGITARRFRLTGDLADVTGFCYLLAPSGSIGHRILAQAPAVGATQALPPIDDTDVVQAFHVASPGMLSAISLRMATYRAIDVDGRIDISVRRAGSGEVLARMSRSAVGIADNVQATFRFRQPVRLERGDHEFVLHYVPGVAGRRLTAWTFPAASGQIRHGAKVLPGAIDYVIAGAPDPGVKVLAEGPTVMAVRNEGCADGPYWTADISSPLRDRSSGNAQLQEYAPARFKVATTARKAGYLVVPMHLQPGWHVTVNGEPVLLERVEEVMPAVALPAGAANVEFRYRPPDLAAGLVLMALSAISLGVFAAWLGRKYGGRAAKQD